MLYIHIPFCRQACTYCNFHFSTSMKHEDEMIQAIIKELRLRYMFLKDKELDSIYIGGGTPSIISNKNISSLFAEINALYTIKPETEITLEANPEDIDESKLSHWQSIGINRLSVGIQSFHQSELEWMNRAHSQEQSYKALELIKAAKMDYSLDLIFGSPGTSNNFWIKNLEQAIAFNPVHISCYALTIENKTALAVKIAKGETIESPPKMLEEQFYLGKKMLTQAGYHHYEISNYAKANKQAIHNSNYWANKAYLGIGPAAHSFDGENKRSWNISNNAKYMQALAKAEFASEQEILSDKDRYNEYVMTRLRTAKGISLFELKRQFTHSFVDYFFQNSKALIEKSYLRFENDHYILADGYLFITDSIASELFFVDDL